MKSFVEHHLNNHKGIWENISIETIQKLSNSMFQMLEILKIYWLEVVALLNEVFLAELLKVNFFEMFLKKHLQKRLF